VGTARRRRPRPRYRLLTDPPRGDWADDPALRSLGGALRRELGDELRAEAEESERVAALLLARQRHLRDVAYEAMSRGDLVSVLCGERAHQGHVVHVRGDLATLRTATRHVHVHLAGPIAVRIDERVRAGGTSDVGGASSFRAQLLELEGSAVEVQATIADAVAGHLTAVALDHVSLEDGASRVWALPTYSVAWVATGV